MMQMEISSLKEALSVVEKRGKRLEDEKVELEEQVETVALDAMARERASLMRQYLAGEHVGWTPKKWIKIYERLEAGLSSEREDEEEEENVVMPSQGQPGAAAEVELAGRLEEVAASAEVSPGLETGIAEEDAAVDKTKDTGLSPGRVDPVVDSQDPPAVD